MDLPGIRNEINDIDSQLQGFSMAYVQITSRWLSIR